MSLTALVFSVLGEIEHFGDTAIHKPQVAEFYQCWCFSATSGGRPALLDSSIERVRPDYVIPGWAEIGHSARLLMCI